MRHRVSESARSTRDRYNSAQARRADSLAARHAAKAIPPYAPNDGFDLCALAITTRR